MTLNVCAHCTSKFSIGAEHCPQCGNCDYYEEGSMAKISVHGGATTVGQPTEEPVFEDSPEVLPEQISPYEGWLLAALQDECVNRGLPKSGNKADLVQRLIDDDERIPEPAGEDDDEEVQPAF